MKHHRVYLQEIKYFITYRSAARVYSISLLSGSLPVTYCYQPKKQNSCNYSFHEITKVTHDKLALVIHLMLFSSPPMAGLCSMQERHSLVPNTKDCENLPANAMDKCRWTKISEIIYRSLAWLWPYILNFTECMFCKMIFLSPLPYM